ncbi:MAG: histidine phosphatase family protein [Deltaproteobacteria bacterium]|nr:histidine phosphatase family protein [Deltaproteobacteria bacterium]
MKPMSALIAALVLSFLVGAAPAEEEPPVTQMPLTVFLVRHAEKLDASRDPALSPAGTERAVTLAGVLGDAGLTHVHSSDYIRTRTTAAPVAKAMGLEVMVYDPRDLPGMATSLRATGGVHLVVGHSNTTPALTELLGGAPGEPIQEKGEYDRLYVVTVAADGTTQSTLLRYGAPFVSGPTKAE